MILMKDKHVSPLIFQDLYHVAANIHSLGNMLTIYDSKRMLISHSSLLITWPLYSAVHKTAVT